MAIPLEQTVGDGHRPTDEMLARCFPVAATVVSRV
jgi:hypothetical protein